MAAIKAELERITADVAKSAAAGADAADEPIGAPLSIVVFGATAPGTTSLRRAAACCAPRAPLMAQPAQMVLL
jgi:hypothetical protein